MSFEKLSERLRTLQESNAQLKILIDRLANIEFQPGSIPLDDDEDNVKTELVSEISQTVNEGKLEVLELQDRVARLGRERLGRNEQEKTEMQRGVQRAVQELKELEVASRKAQLEARRKLQIARRQERNILVQSFQQVNSASNSGRSSPAVGIRSQAPQMQMYSREDKIVNATSNVTQALRRTHEMMAQELSKSQYAQETLRESTMALDTLGETYSVLDTMLSSSKNLLGTLLRSQKSDTWYLETARNILIATIMWLLFRRLLYGPLWWFLYAPLKAVFYLFYQAWVGVFAAVGLVRTSSVAVRGSLAVGGGATVDVDNSARATMAGSDAPVIDIGSESRSTDTPQREESASDQVGRIIDGSQSNEPAEIDDEKSPVNERPHNEEDEVQKNPKKRMWEEEKEALKEAQRQADYRREKDEL